MKTLLKTTLLTILLTSLLTGCATSNNNISVGKNQKVNQKENNITVGDVVAAPIYAFLTVGYVATKAVTLATEGVVYVGAKTYKAGKNAVNAISNDDKKVSTSSEGVKND